MKDSTTKLNKWLGPVPFLTVIAVWKVASLVIDAEIIMPSPEVAFQRLFALAATQMFWQTLMATLTRTMLGFAASLFVGVVVGVLSGVNKTAHSFARPFVLISRSTPLMSIILLALIWFKSDQVPIFVSFLVCFPLIHANVVEGIRSIDPGLREMAVVFRVSWWRRMLELYLPSILPFILAGSATALGLGLKVVVAAEALSQPKVAIGTRMQVERLYLETTGVFAWTIAALLMSWALEGVMRAVEKRAFGWRRIC